MNLSRLLVLPVLLAAGAVHASHPLPVSNLRQSQSGVSVPAGGAISGNAIQVTADSHMDTCDYTTPNYRLEVELRPVGSAFTGVPTHSSSFMAKPACQYQAYPLVTLSGLGTGAWKWQAREYIGGYSSAWVPFNAGATAFTVGGVDLSPGTLAFGPQRVNQSSTPRVVNVTNNGGATITVSSASVTGPFTLFSEPAYPHTLAAGASVAFGVVAAPTALGAASGTLTVVSSAGSSPHTANLTVTGAEPSLALSTTSVSFGDAGINSAPVTRTVTLYNTGNMALTVSGGSVNPPFAVSGLSNLTVAAGGSETFTVSYAPTAQQAHAATLSIHSDAPNSPHTVALSGTGVAPQLAISPGTINFPDAVVGQTSAPVTVTLTNTGTGSLVVGAPTVSTGFTTTFPGATIAQGANTGFAVRFAPTAPGSIAGSITLPSNDAAGAKTIILSGTARAPALTAAPSSHNFGTVTLGTSQTLVVALSNPGDAPLTISGLSFNGTNASDYALSTPPSLPATVAAGSSLQLTVRFNPAGLGLRSAALQIQSNRYPAGNLQVAFTGTGDGPQIAVSPSFVAFGSTNVNTTLVRTFNVSNNGSQPLTVSGISFSTGNSTDFRATTSLPFTVTPGGSQTVAVDFRPGAAGARSSKAVVASNDPMNPGVDVWLDGVGLAPDVTVSPTSLGFGKVREGQTASRTFTIQNAGTGPLTVSSLMITGAGAAKFKVIGVSAPFTLAPSTPPTTIQVNYSPTAVGATSAQLSVVSDDPDSPSISVALSGEGVAPALSLSAANLNFGGQLVNRQSTVRTVQISNTGTAPLLVSTLALTGSSASAYSFGAPPTPFTIPVNGKQTVNVSLTPKVVGEQSAKLFLQTDAPGSTTANVNLVGMGLTELFSVNPITLQFPIVKAGTVGDTLNVTITNASGDSIPLSSATLEGASAGDYEVGFDAGNLAPGASAVVEVTYLPKTAGQHVAELHLVSSDARIPRSVVTLEGNAVSQVLEATPPAIDYGPVGEGESKTELIYITNRTSKVVTLASANSSNPEFMADPAGLISLQPGGSTNLPIIFKPSHQHYAIGTVSVSIDGQAPGQSEVTIAVSGTGIESVSAKAGGCSAAGGPLAAWALLTLAGTALARRRR